MANRTGPFSWPALHGFGMKQGEGGSVAILRHTPTEAVLGYRITRIERPRASQAPMTQGCDILSHIRS